MLDEPDADELLPIDEPGDELPLNPAEPELLIPVEPLFPVPELLLPLRPADPPADPLVEGIEAEPEPDAAVFSFG